MIKFEITFLAAGILHIRTTFNMKIVFITGANKALALKQRGSLHKGTIMFI
jgi:hypothetical protein